MKDNSSLSLLLLLPLEPVYHPNPHSSYSFSSIILQTYTNTAILKDKCSWPIAAWAATHCLSGSFSTLLAFCAGDYKWVPDCRWWRTWRHAPQNEVWSTKDGDGCVVQGCAQQFNISHSLTLLSMSHPFYVMVGGGLATVDVPTDLIEVFFFDFSLDFCFYRECREWIFF